MGFIGRHLGRRLDGNYIGIDLRQGKDILTCDLPDADRVYHLAANTAAADPEFVRSAEVNIMGTLRLLYRYGNRLVLASSSMVNYPHTPYAISKRAAEDYAAHVGAAIVRFPNVFGAGGHSVVDKFGAAAIAEVRGTGEQMRTYAHVSVAVDALLAAEPGKTLIVGGLDMTVNEIAQILNRRTTHVQGDPLDLLDGRQKGATWPK
jgi:nucleoside-diphosphate-sugar epimerase